MGKSWPSKENAYQYAKNKATVVIEEGNLKPNVFSDLILQIVSGQKKKGDMSKAALEFSKPKAADDIAQHLLQIV